MFNCLFVYYHALNGMEIKEATTQTAIFQEIFSLKKQYKKFMCLYGVAQWNKRFICECKGLYVETRKGCFNYIC